MAAVAFPALKPSGRSYNPGEYPQTEFKALNGATTRMLYGNRRTNAELSLDFQNISDSEAALILANYERVAPTADWVSFTTATGAVGAGSTLAPYLLESASGLRWRYAAPPSVSSVFPGISTVQCRFVGQLDAA
jgi:hypothetical protein